MLRATVHLARRVIRIDEIDDVSANLVVRSIEGPELRLDPALQRLATDAVSTAIDVFDEQLHPRIQISGIDRQRISRRQLLDGEMRFDALDAIGERETWSGRTPRMAVGRVHT